MSPALTARVRDAQDKARVLREALPWITRWAGRTIVVKYGGNAMPPAGADPLSEAFAADVALLHRVGLRVVVVHGGGPQITALSEQLGLQPAFVDGRRVTDPATLDVVRMVLLGQVNPWLVGLIQAAGARAAGVAGTDAELLHVRPLAPELGLVGAVDHVDPHVLGGLLGDGVIPVVATVGRGPDGQDYNVNADTAAGAIAVALGADKLIYLTNVPGLYEHFGAENGGTLLSEVTVDRLRAMLAAGDLHTGMVPKVEAALEALDVGVQKIHIVDARIPHSLLLEIYSNQGVGTEVVRG
jgi:acetylglutamate kinase